MNRPRIWREANTWCYSVPLVDGVAVGSAGTWRAAYDRTCELVVEELARLRRQARRR